MPGALPARDGDCGCAERALARGLWAALDRVPGFSTYTLWPPGSVDRVGVATFNLDGHRHPPLAAVVSAEHAIGVRHGCFCAHPLLTRLLDCPPPRCSGYGRR